MYQKKLMGIEVNYSDPVRRKQEIGPLSHIRRNVLNITMVILTQIMQL